MVDTQLVAAREGGQELVRARVSRAIAGERCVMGEVCCISPRWRDAFYVFF